MLELENRILEELIYEKVRLTVDLCELLAFEADLSASIGRALERSRLSPEERATMAMTYLERAWERLGDELLGELGHDSPEEAPGDAHDDGLAAPREDPVGPVGRGRSARRPRAAPEVEP